MKGNLKIPALFLSLGIAFFASMPCYAGSAKHDATNIKAEGQTAEHSQSATKARNINNSAWHGADKSHDAGNPQSGTVDIIGGTDSNKQEEDKSSFTDIEKKDVTPWKGTITGIVASFMSGLGLMLIAATLLASIISDEVTYSRYIITRIAQALFVAAAAAFATAIAFATILMVEYKQYMLGAIWAGIATFSLAEAIYMTYKCQSPTTYYDPDTAKRYTVSTDAFYQALKKVAILSFLMLGISAVAGGTMTWYSYERISDEKQTQQTDTSHHDEDHQEDDDEQEEDD